MRPTFAFGEQKDLKSLPLGYSSRERERSGFWLTSGGFRLEVALILIYSCLPCSQCMADYGTREANHGTIDAPKKCRINNPTHSPTLEVLSPYGLRNLGRQESICYLLRQVHSD